ncbi:MAG: hypothetical protein SPD54_01770 [Parabacteroides sp.]|nr:hypothetical protein [Parabacteroides sp.]
MVHSSKARRSCCTNHRRNRHSFRASIETAGNFLNLLSHVTGQKKNEEGRYELVGVPYSQYVKTDIDFFLLRFDTGFKASVRSATGEFAQMGHHPIQFQG